MRFAVFANANDDWNYSSAEPVGIFEAETSEEAEEQAEEAYKGRLGWKFCAVELDG